MSYLANRVRFSTATTGTGPVAIGAAAATFFVPSGAAPAVPDGATVSLLIADGNAVELSTGIYNVAAQTITRTLVQSTTGALLNLSGAAVVSLTALASDLTTDPLDLTQPAVSVPVGKVRVGARAFASFLSPTYNTSQGGPERMLQPSMMRTLQFSIRGIGGQAGTTNITYIGWIANSFTALGSAQGRNPTATSKATRAQRAGYGTGTTAGSVCGHYMSIAGSRAFTMSAGSGLGGFVYSHRFMLNDAVAGARSFAGLSTSTAAPTNVDPSTLTDSIGLAQVDASANICLVYGGSSPQPPIDLGASFPAGTAATDLYELLLYSDPNDSTYLGWRVERINTGDVATGTIANTTPGVTLPASTTFLGPRTWRTNNTAAAAVGIDIVMISGQIDY